LCRRFHHHFFDGLLAQPLSHSSQVVGAAADLAACKLVLAVDLDVGHNDRQHSFVHIDSCYLVRHRYPPAVRERAWYSINLGRRLALPPEEELPPNDSLNRARSDQTVVWLQTLHCCFDLAVPA
jgi:hypothetical protein